MRNFKAIIFGNQETGKTELFYNLSGTEYEHSSYQYTNTVAPDLNQLVIKTEENTEKTNFLIWDIPGKEQYKKKADPLLSKADIGLYCIDLSKEITDEMVEEAKAHIDDFKQNSPDALVVITGTKSDIALPDALLSVSEKFADYQFVSTSSNKINGLDDLYKIFANQGKELTLKELQKVPSVNPLLAPTATFKPAKSKPTPIPTPNHPSTPTLNLTLTLFGQPEANTITPEMKNITVNRLLWARDRCLPDSLLYNALHNFMIQAKNAPHTIQASLGKEVNNLINNLLNPQVTNKAPVITNFIEQNNAHLNDNYQWLKDSILAVAIAATLTVTASMIGFGIGFAIGTWAGPGAMITGFAMGGTLGAGALAYAGYRFLKTTTPVGPVENENINNNLNKP